MMAANAVYLQVGRRQNKKKVASLKQNMGGSEEPELEIKFTFY
jgi:hypothetical protein